MSKIPFVDFFRKKRKRIRQKKFYAQFIGPGDLVFDVGANHGDYTEIFASLGARVIAIEPQQKCVSALKKRFQGNQNILIEDLAVGSAPGEGKLHIGNMDQVSSLSDNFIQKYGCYDYLSWETTETVKITTLDLLAAKYGFPAFVKIDAEDFDDEVIKGMSFRPQAMSFEYATLIKQTCLNCIDIIGEAAYNFTPYEHFSFSSEKWMNEGSIKSTIEKMPDNILHGDVFVKFKNP